MKSNHFGVGAETNKNYLKSRLSLQ